VSTEPPGFEIYRRQNSRGWRRDPVVTFSRASVITINEAAYRILGQPPAVVLLWARDERVVGLRPADAGEKGAYRCRMTPSSTRVVSARAFFRWAGIAADGVRRPLVMDDGIGCIRLP
jgi:hypothetical protein